MYQVIYTGRLISLYHRSPYLQKMYVVIASKIYVMCRKYHPKDKYRHYFQRKIREVEWRGEATRHSVFWICLRIKLRQRRIGLSHSLQYYQHSILSAVMKPTSGSWRVAPFLFDSSIGTSVNWEAAEKNHKLNININYKICIWDHSPNGFS